MSFAKRFALVLSVITVVVACDSTQAAPILAYTTPSTWAGNQGYGSGFGMTFTTNSPIEVTQLGLFSGTGTGFSSTNADYVTLFDSTTDTVVAQLEFGNGTGNGTQVSGTADYVKSLATPVVLPANFNGAIVAYYSNGVDELNNSGGVSADAPSETGSPYLKYTGAGINSGSTPDIYPTGTDGGPANRYSGPTFAFISVPEPASLVLGALGAIGLVLVGWRRRAA